MYRLDGLTFSISLHSALKMIFVLEQGSGEGIDSAERALKRRRVHDAEVAWTSVSLASAPPSQNIKSLRQTVTKFANLLLLFVCVPDNGIASRIVANSRSSTSYIACSGTLHGFAACLVM